MTLLPDAVTLAFLLLSVALSGVGAAALAVWGIDLWRMWLNRRRGGGRTIA